MNEGRRAEAQDLLSVLVPDPSRLDLDELSVDVRQHLLHLILQ